MRLIKLFCFQVKYYVCKIYLAKPGRTVHLLKIKSKFAKGRKKAKKHEIDLNMILGSDPSWDWRSKLLAKDNADENQDEFLSGNRNMDGDREESKEMRVD